MVVVLDRREELTGGCGRARRALRRSDLLVLLCPLRFDFCVLSSSGMSCVEVTP